MTPFQLLNCDIAGVRWGQGGRRILALHGYLDHANSFKRLAEALPDCEIWAIDLPGHGLSAPLPKVDGTFILQWLPMLGRVLDELNWTDYTIIGHSMGAIVSQMLAAVDTRVQHLISLDALGPIASTTDVNVQRFQTLYNRRNKEFPIKYYGSYQELVQTRLTGPFPLSETAAKVMAERAVGWGKKGWFHRYDRGLRDESIWRMSEDEVRTWLSQIQCPVHLLIFAAHEWQHYRAVFEHRQASIRHLTLEFMEGSHHLHLEEPQRVATWIQSALAAKTAVRTSDSGH